MNEISLISLLYYLFVGLERMWKVIVCGVLVKENMATPEGRCVVRVV